MTKEFDSEEFESADDLRLGEITGEQLAIGQNEDLTEEEVRRRQADLEKAKEPVLAHMVSEVEDGDDIADDVMPGGLDLKQLKDKKE